jgi:hypothetical protein
MRIVFCQQTGFADTVAVIREATVRSISLLVPKVAVQGTVLD